MQRDWKMHRAGGVTFVAVAVVLWMCSQTAQAHAPPTNKVFAVKNAVAGQYIVVLPAETHAEAVTILAAALTKKHGGRVTHRYAARAGSLRGFAVRGLTARQARSLAADRRVKFVEQVARVYPAGKRTNPGWALDRIDQRSNSPSGVYRFSADGTSVRVYVLDTGIEATHPEFFGNPVETGTDTFGGTGAPCDGHGTAMAALIAGHTKGVAPAATIVNVKVFNCTLIGNNTANIIAGIDWVTNHAQLPAVANLSLQLQYGATSPTMRTAIADLLQKDVVVVVAAGNDNNDVAQVEPANYPGVIAVGASTSTGARWVNSGSPVTGCSMPAGGCGSNFGSAVSIFGPGSGVQTADLGGTYTSPPAGTSSAAAIISGVAAATLQAFWRPLQPGIAYLMSPGEQVRAIILANATPGVLTDVRTSANSLVFAETWPISLGRFEISSPGGLTSVASREASSGATPSVYVSGGSQTRFDEIPASVASPYAAQAYDDQVSRWTTPVNMNDGSCADAYDAGIAHIWLACTRTSAQSMDAIVKAVSVYDGAPIGEVTVGHSTAAPPGQTCAQPNSIARAVRVDNATGAVFVVGDTWCGTGARTAFLSMVDTQATTVVWEKRIFNQGTKSSSAHALAFGGGVVTVAGHQTLSSAGAVHTGHLGQYSQNGGLSLGSGFDFVGPSMANGISRDASSGDLYVAATLETTKGNVGIVARFNSSLTKTWEQNIDGANLFGVAALNDGVIAAGGTHRYLPEWPVIWPQFAFIVGKPLTGQGDRGFLMRLDDGGTLRWTHYVDGGTVTGVVLEGQQELGDNVLIHAVGSDIQPPCTAPPGTKCVQPPTTSFVESFRIK